MRRCHRKVVAARLCLPHYDRQGRYGDYTIRNRPWTAAERTKVEALVRRSLGKRLPTGRIAALARELRRSELATYRMVKIVRTELRAKQA